MQLTTTELALCLVATALLLGILILLGRWLFRALGRSAPTGRTLLAAGFVAVGVVGLTDLVMLWCLLEYALFGVELEPDTLRKLLNRAGLWAPLASVGLMAAHSFVPFPAEVIAIANGMAFGLWGGIAVTWLGAMVGAVLAYELARSLGPAARTRLIPSRQQVHLERLVGDFGTRTMLVVRFIPVISFNLVNYAAGLAGVDRVTFLWTTALGILPITVLSVLVGSAALHLPPYLWILGGFGIVVAMVAAQVCQRLAKRQSPGYPPGP